MSNALLDTTLTQCDRFAIHIYGTSNSPTASPTTPVWNKHHSWVRLAKIILTDWSCQPFSTARVLHLLSSSRRSTKNPVYRNNDGNIYICTYKYIYVYIYHLVTRQSKCQFQTMYSVWTKSQLVSYLEKKTFPNTPFQRNCKNTISYCCPLCHCQCPPVGKMIVPPQKTAQTKKESIDEEIPAPTRLPQYNLKSYIKTTEKRETFSSIPAIKVQHLTEFPIKTSKAKKSRRSQVFDRIWIPTGPSHVGSIVGSLYILYTAARAIMYSMGVPVWSISGGVLVSKISSRGPIMFCHWIVEYLCEWATAEIQTWIHRIGMSVLFQWLKVLYCLLSLPYLDFHY